MREFNITVGGATIANAVQTAVFINPPAAPSINVEILRCWAGQTGSTASAQSRISLASKVTAFPTLTSFTPVKLKTADPNASVITGNTTGAAGTCGVTASVEGAGAVTSRYEDAFNVLNGWLYVPTPPETTIFPAGSTSGIALYFPAAAPTLTNWSYGITFREV